MTTTGEFAAERAQLGTRDRDELHEIASAMGVRGATRLRKADLIEAILDKATSGASVPEPTGEKPKKRATRRKAGDAEAVPPDSGGEGPGGGERDGAGRAAAGDRPDDGDRPAPRRAGGVSEQPGPEAGEPQRLRFGGASGGPTASGRSERSERP